jgi:hypothetical protein
MKSKPEEEEAVEIRGTEDTTSEVLVDDYKDLEIEMIEGSRAKTLWWMKHYD